MPHYLTYYVSGSTATLQEETESKIFYNVSLSISGSEYETGDGFVSSVGTIRIYLHSGSTLIADFPYDQTNLIIDSSSTTYYQFPQPDINFGYSISSQNTYPYNFQLLESSSLEVVSSAPILGGDNIYGVNLFSTKKYIAEMYTGGNKYNQALLYDETSSLIYSSSWITGSGSILLELTGSPSYYLALSISGSTCCAPTLESIENIGFERLKFNYSKGCGTFNSMSVFYSTDLYEWNVIHSGSSTSVTISDSGSYPTTPTYYRLIQYCSGSEEYNSEPSNIILYNPKNIPTNPDYYYVSIVGRSSVNEISRVFVYSPDSGSTTVDLGYITYTPTYQEIAAFFIYSGSTLIINPNVSYNFGIGYEGDFSGYCGCTVIYPQIISNNTTIYVNIESDGFPCC